MAAIEETVYQNPKTHEAAAKWKRSFLAAYEAFYGEKLSIPRWSEIEDEYAVND